MKLAAYIGLFAIFLCAPATHADDAPEVFSFQLNNDEEIDGSTPEMQLQMARRLVHDMMVWGRQLRAMKGPAAELGRPEIVACLEEKAAEAEAYFTVAKRNFARLIRITQQEMSAAGELRLILVAYRRVGQLRASYPQCYESEAP